MSGTGRNRSIPEIDRKALMHDLWDGVYDRFDPDLKAPNDQWDWFEEHISQPVVALLCFVYGHEPVRDQCGQEAHDHCVWCQKLMPGAASRKQPLHELKESP